MPDTCIVTGVAGFIGSQLACALLQRGHRLIGIDNFDPFYDRAAKERNVQRVKACSRAPDSFRMVEADIRDSAKFKDIFTSIRPSAIFHIAALAGVRPSIADPARYVSVNLDGLVSVLDAARSAGCSNVVFASSSSVYGNNAKVPFAETDPVDDPVSPYAATKRAGELVCRTYAHLFGMRIAALRFFTVFGPAQRPDLAIGKFMRLIANEEEVPMFGDGSTSRDYTYIDDIIAGVLASFDVVAGRRAVMSMSSGHAEDRGAHFSGGGFFRIYNLGGSHPVTLAGMIDAIARVVGKPVRITRLPMQPGDVERTYADLTRSAAELGYQPRTAFVDGLMKQWDWLRQTD